MSNEIKVGDKVRVREDAPKIFFNRSVCCYPDYIFEVREVEDGNADIYFGSGKISIAAFVLPLKYLVKVEEEKKLKFKIGDKVIFIPTGKVKVVSRINANSLYTVTEPNGQSPLCVRETELAPYIEHNAPKFKVGDRVRNVKSDLCGIALNIEHGIVEVGIPYDKEKHYWNTDIVELFEPTEQTEAEKKPYDGISEETANEISDMLEAYAKALSGIADSFDWQRYEADLAKEIALKVANKFNAPKEVAEYAVSVAKAVVEGLKGK